MEEDEDMFLLRRLKDGDFKAYERLYKKYHKSLSTLAFYLLKDNLEAEDLVQMLFIEMWERQLYQSVHSSISHYLHRAVKNRCLSVLEKNKTRQKRLDNYTLTLEDAVYNDRLEQQESEKRMSAILTELPSKRSQAFRLVYLEDKKYKEAADEMGITLNSIKTHLKLAVKVLQQKLINLK